MPCIACYLPNNSFIIFQVVSVLSLDFEILVLIVIVFVSFITFVNILQYAL